MRTRLACIFAVTLAAVLITAPGCNSSNTTSFGGSDSWIKVLSLGDIPVTAGRTVNAPLSHISKIRFEVSRPVTPLSLEDLLDFYIYIENMDNSNPWTRDFIFTEKMLDRSGELIWVGETNHIVEYRLKRPLSFPYWVLEEKTWGKPGDRIRVKIQWAVAKLADDTQVQYYGDEFFILWTGSAYGPVPGGDIETGFGTYIDQLYIGDVPVSPGTIVNVPLSNTNRIRIELLKPISAASLSLLFNLQLRIVNLDTDAAYLLDDSVIDENGELVWVDDENMIIEFRLNHDLSYIRSGGQVHNLGSPGDRFRIWIDEAAARLQDGTTMSIRGDSFDVVWSESGS